MTTGSQLHGARWPRFNCVQMIETMSGDYRWLQVFTVDENLEKLKSVNGGLVVVSGQPVSDELVTLTPPRDDVVCIRDVTATERSLARPPGSALIVDGPRSDGGGGRER